MKSEFEFIRHLRAQVASRNADLICGIGDDTAIIREQSGRETLVTADLLIEEVHFKTDWTPARMLGHKSLAVSLSDIAAMGGTPRYALLTLGIPAKKFSNDSSEKFWTEFFAGYFALAQSCGVALIGGDTSSSPDRLTIDSIVLGTCTAGKAIRRNGARVGDAIYVTGEIGASMAGLELLRRGERVGNMSDTVRQKALRAHLLPQPRVEFGRRLGEAGLAHSMIDVSDGLAQDLAHLCEESKARAVIDYEAVPVATAAQQIAESSEHAFALAISGGEDYELLLTASPENEAALFEIGRVCQLLLTRIGEIIAAEKSSADSLLLLHRAGRTEPLAAQGYDHFA